MTKFLEMLEAKKGRLLFETAIIWSVDSNILLNNLFIRFYPINSCVFEVLKNHITHVCFIFSNMFLLVFNVTFLTYGMETVSETKDVVPLLKSLFNYII